jgi:hypothetical protein
MRDGSPAAKLCRDGNPPDFVQYEQACRLTYRNRIELNGGAVLRYRRTRRSPVDWNPRQKDLLEREFFGWIHVENERVGAIHLLEYRGSPFLWNEEFLQIMDSMSFAQSELAKALIAAWEDVGDDLFSFGDVIEFRCAWTDKRRCPPGLWASAAIRLINLECPDYSILALKAFPLEYEGNGGDLVDASLRRRQEAMRRYYRSVLGVTSIPGNDEWMYRIHPRLDGLVDAPQDSLTPVGA